MKKFLLSILFILQFSLTFAATAKYVSEEYSIFLNYNDVITQGDAIFVRMNITIPKNHKKTKSDSDKKATLQLLQDKKVIETAPFYQINKAKKTTTELLCGIPISLWLKDGNYSLKVIFVDADAEAQEFTLPVTLKLRDFPEEVIPLDEKNTAIKTDNSPERAAQIDELNNIIFTSIPSDVYSLKKFNSPTTSERYTAYFGDKRTYKYTNGKSSSSFHYGNDYGVPTGTDVRSCAEGRVVMAESRISTGWSVVVEHLPGLYSLYYHMSELNVKEGEMVKQGDLLGKSGATGLATGPHLHWEIRLNGSAVRPEFFLNNFTFDEN